MTKKESEQTTYMYPNHRTVLKNVTGINRHPIICVLFSAVCIVASLNGVSHYKLKAFSQYDALASAAFLKCQIYLTKYHI